jgi:hypothetical protein
MQETMYAMHTVFAPCHGTTLHPATKGVKWEGIYTYIIQTNQICFKKTIYIQNIKTGENLKVRSTESYLSILFDELALEIKTTPIWGNV